MDEVRIVGILRLARSWKRIRRVVAKVAE